MKETDKPIAEIQRHNSRAFAVVVVSVVLVGGAILLALLRNWLQHL